MFQIDEPGVPTSPPAIPPAGTPGYYQEGNAATGTAPIAVRAWWLNMLQTELLTLVQGGGVTPSKTSNGQLLQACDNRYVNTTGDVMTGGLQAPMFVGGNVVAGQLAVFESNVSAGYPGQLFTGSLGGSTVFNVDPNGTVTAGSLLAGYAVGGQLSLIAANAASGYPGQLFTATSNNAIVFNVNKIGDVSTQTTLTVGQINPFTGNNHSGTNPINNGQQGIWLAGGGIFCYAPPANGGSAGNFRGDANNGDIVGFYSGPAPGQLASLVGSVSNVNGTSVAFNSTSDYRLKRDVEALTGSLDLVARIAPKSFAYRADTDGRRVHGFIAHELAEIVPHAVKGEKDAVEDTDHGERIVPQMIDYSKLVPLLVGAIQELQAKVAVLEARP